MKPQHSPSSEGSSSTVETYAPRCLIDPNGEKSTQLRTYLQAYCGQFKTERRRYASFVTLCNYALEALSTLEDLSLSLHQPASDDEKLLFHVSHTRTIECDHGYREPDVVLVTKSTARNAAHSEDESDGGAML
ncbi:hypothetical protein FRC03_005365 [Tulasnella sp. 419]|nr:hypothetical protein FRC03_005365 [Tulasnella sp. 419]